MTCSDASIPHPDTMEKVSELLLRNSTRFRQKEMLLVNPPRDGAFSALAQSGRVSRIFTQDYGDYRWFLASGAVAEFGISPERLPSNLDVVLIQPRERERLNLLLHALGSQLQDASTLWLAGENRTGIKSAGKNLAAFFTTVNKVDNARHCVLYEAAKPVGVKPFELADYETAWTLPEPWSDIQVVSLAGTFANGKLDQGTRLLLECRPELKPGMRVLDFACGSGVIGLTLLAQQPDIELVMLDTSALALESARRSLRTNHRTAQVLPSDGLDAVEGTFDWIITNPPFHRGVDNDLEIARRFFSDAGRHLKATGLMVLVYNQHLPYQGWLKEYFSRVEIINLNRAFKVAVVSDAKT